MRLTAVDAHALSSPIDPPQERRFAGGVRTLHKRDVVLVTVDAADGTRGYAPAGATSSAMREHFEGASQRAFADVVSGPVADRLEGESLDRPADCHDLLDGVALPPLVRTQAASAVDVALYDAFGKRRGVPVCELLAGDIGRESATVSASRAAAPDPLPLYASAGMYMRPERYADQAATLESAGFGGYKFRPGIGPEGDARTAALLGDAVGPGFDLMADAHTWWKLEDPGSRPGGRAGRPDRTPGYDDADLADVLAAYEDAGLRWLEEPVPPGDHAAYERLAGRTGTPLAGGESEPDAAGLRALAETGAVGVLQGDVRHHGGFTGCLRAVDHCAGTGVQFVPHNFGTWLGLAANAHLVAAGRETDLLEYPVFEADPALDADVDPGMYPFPLAFDIVEEHLAVDGGRFRVPDGPGLGVTVDESVVEAYPFREGAWTTFAYDR